MKTVTLPPVIDLQAVGALRQTLIDYRGESLEIDASQVTRLGALGLQVLLSARLTWSADKRAFHIVNPSENFSEALEQFASPDLNASPDCRNNV